MIASSGTDWEKSPANGGMRISEAQANYQIFGVAHLSCPELARSPRPEEMPETLFEMWPQAMELVESFRCQPEQHVLPGYDREKIEKVVIPNAIVALNRKSRAAREKAIRILNAIADLPEEARVALRQAEEVHRTDVPRKTGTKTRK